MNAEFIGHLRKPSKKNPHMAVNGICRNRCHVTTILIRSSCYYSAEYL